MLDWADWGGVGALPVQTGQGGGARAAQMEQILAQTSQGPSKAPF